MSASQTLRAIAIKTGYSNSEIAGATYTINLPSADFAIAISPASLTVASGQSGTATIAITPVDGFSSSILLTCSGLPLGASCTFSPSTVTPAGVATWATLTVTRAKTTSLLRRDSQVGFPPLVLAVAVCGFCWGRRKRFQMLLLIAFSLGAASLLNGCGGGTSGGGSIPVPQPTTSTVTVDAAAGQNRHSATFSLTMN